MVDFIKRFFNYYILIIFFLIFNEYTLSLFDNSPPLSNNSILSIRKIEIFVLIIFFYFKFIYLNKNLKFINNKILNFIKKISFILVILIIGDQSLKFFGFGLDNHWFEEDEIRYNTPYDMFSNKPNVLDHNNHGFRGISIDKKIDPDVIKIAFLGGSTGYTGSPPIPEILEKNLKEDGIKNVVYNFSVNSSNHNQHVHRLVKFINTNFDIIIFYGGNNESIQYLQYETRPSYPYNFFIKNDISIFKMFLIKYSSIFGIIENKTGIISGINLKRKEISSNFETWSNDIVNNYVNTIEKAQKLFGKNLKSNKCQNVIFVPILQPVNPRNENEIKLWKKMKLSIRKNPNFIDYSDIHNDIKFYDNVHVDQLSRMKISRLISKDLLSIIKKRCN